MRNILVVDDSPTMRRMVIVSLRNLGNTHFYEAASGLEAIERLALAHMDLMVLDLNMPDMHGFEVLKFIRQHQIYQTLPIIVLTTRGDETSQHDAINAGASIYLTKPFDPQALVAHVRELLS